MSLPSPEPAVLPSFVADPGAGLARLLGAIGRSIPNSDMAAEPYRTFLEAVAVAVYTTDAAGRITFFNEAAVELWGRRPDLGEEWCGSLRIFELDGTPLPHDACPMAIALKENRSVRGVTALAERPDGRRVAFEPYPTPLRSEDGTLAGAVNVLVDVTERLAAENALRDAAAALAASNAVKDEFLGLVSHELRTPVTSIYGNAVLLADRLDAAEPEAGMIRDLSEDADRLLRIVENLLQMTRLGSGSALECEPLVLGRAASAAVQSRQRRHPEREIRLQLETSSLVVEADDVPLDMVLENLLSNADKYSPPGRPIDVVVSAGGDEGIVRILDRGIGIPGEIASDVFAAFYREDRARRMAGGVGVGLAVCKRVVDALGGRIWAGPRDGGGAEVGFALPLSRELDEAGAA